MRFSSEQKTKLKNNQLIADVWYTFRKLRNRLLIIKYHKLPINENAVLLNNFNGKGFGCNPRVIAEKLHELSPDIKLIWVCENDSIIKSLPNYLDTVLFETNAYYKAIATSKVWVFNELVQDGTYKRNEQLYIQTYHGDRGFKKVGYDATDNEHYRKLTRKRKIIEGHICDLFLAGSTYAEKFIRSAFSYHGDILLQGTPRDDRLVTGDITECIKIKESLGISLEKQILLYAPTFRDTSNVEGKTGSDIDLPAILNALQAHSGNEWICLLRAHGGSRLIANSVTENDSAFFDVTKYPDMADLLLISDCLITDYSSSAGDFALTGKMILLYQDDIVEYTCNNRSMYFDMKDSPFWIAHNTDEAKSIISSYTSERAKANDDLILQFYGSKETGYATELVAEKIIDYLKASNVKQRTTE